MGKDWLVTAGARALSRGSHRNYSSRQNDYIKAAASGNKDRARCVFSDKRGKVIGAEKLTRERSSA
jgi:hypothetical protein